MPKQRALLLINRHSRQGKKHFAQANFYLQQMGIDVVGEQIKNSLQLPDLIRSYQHKVDLVIVGGGDGTLNAAVEGLLATGLPLGILPLGTANDLARTLKIPFSLEKACQIIAQGHQEQIDLGKVNDKYFFNVASCGLSVEITRQLNKKAKRRWGIFAYAITALKVLLKARPFHAEIRLATQSMRVKTVQIAVGNGRHYGGGMTVAADATIDDQKLDLYSIEIKYWWQILGLLPRLWSGNYQASNWVRTIRTTEVEIYTRKPKRINTDGELTTYTPATFRVMPKILSVIVPTEDYSKN